MPAKLEDLRLQGFTWLGAYFVETQQAFGSKVAVAAFDRLALTLADIAAIHAHLPAHLMHRTLDDLPIVVPAGSGLGDRFANIYRSLCNKVGVKLAPNCKNHVKAFEKSTQGTVLGIRFDTVNSTWSISIEKQTSLLNKISKSMQGTPMTLLETQQLVGSLNDFGQMCQFLRGFRLPIQSFLSSFVGDENISLVPTEEMKADLRVWAAAVAEAGRGLPIPHRLPSFHNCKYTFVSDAAGAQFCKVDGRFIPYGPSQERGAASVNSLETGKLWFCNVIYWPDEFLFHGRDSLDHAYGCKSATLEVIALILPFLSIPAKLIGQKVLLLTDNMSVVFGWDSKKINHDKSASIFIRALHIIAFYLGCSVQIEHLPRVSTPSAVLADSLTRKSTTTDSVSRMIDGIVSYHVPSVLTDWLLQPTEDWDLAIRLLDCVKQLVES